MHFICYGAIEFLALSVLTGNDFAALIFVYFEALIDDKSIYNGTEVRRQSVGGVFWHYI